MFSTKSKEFLTWAGIPYTTGWRTRPSHVCGYDISILKTFHYFQKLDLYDNLVGHLGRCVVCCAPVRHLKHDKVLDEHFKMDQSLRVLIAMYNGQHSEHTNPARIEFFNEGFELYLKKQFPEIELPKVQPITTIDADTSVSSSPSKLSLKSKESKQNVTNPENINSSDVTPSSTTILLLGHEQTTYATTKLPSPASNISSPNSPTSFSPISPNYNEDASRRKKAKLFLKSLFTKQISDSPTEPAGASKRQKVKAFFKKVLGHSQKKCQEKAEQQLIKRDMRLAVAIVAKIAPQGVLFGSLRFCMCAVKKLQPAALSLQKIETRCSIFPKREIAQLGAKSVKAICWHDLSDTLESKGALSLRQIDVNCTRLATLKPRVAGVVAVRTIQNVFVSSPSGVNLLTELISTPQAFVRVMIATFNTDVLTGALLRAPFVQVQSEKIAVAAPKKRVDKKFFKPFDLARARAQVREELEARELAYKEIIRARKPLNVTYHGLEEQRLLVEETFKCCLRFPEPLDLVLLPKRMGRTPYMALPSPFMYNEDEELDFVDEMVDYYRPTVADNNSSPCVIDGSVHITRCRHKDMCSMQTTDLSVLMEQENLRKFVQFCQLAYPRLGFRSLQHSSFQQLVEIVKERSDLVEGLQAGCTRWHKSHCLARSQVLESLTVLTSMRHHMTLVDTNELKLIKYFPNFWKEVRDLADEDRFYRVGDFILDQTRRFQQKLKRASAKEMTMHQVYLENMALLLDPNFEIPENFDFEVVVLLDEHIETVYRELNLMTWSELRPLIEKVEWASMAFLITHDTFEYVLTRDASVRKLKIDLANL